MVDDLREIWCRVVERVRGELGSANLNLLMENARPVRFQSGTLTISFTDEWARDWIEARYMPDLSRIVRELVPDVKSLELVTTGANGGGARAAHFEPSHYSSSSPSTPGYSTSDQSGYSANGAHPARDAERDRMMGAPLNPRYTFDSFVVGPSNRFAQAASLAVAEDPAGAYNPLFLYGGVGLGKTHLMQAIAHYVRENHRKLYVVYVSSETFTNDLINALSRRSMAEFRKKYRSVDLLLIDDIQFVAGKEQTQEEFFHTFNALYEAEKQIVISSDRPPKEIPTLEERLRSRFEWGLTTDIQPPDLETRVAILRRKASEEGLALSNDVLLYIANEIQSNIRELEGALIRVVAFASLHGCDITLDVTMEALKDLLSARKTRAITIEAIQQAVAQHFGIKAEEMKSKKRTRAVAYPRQIAMYLARELTDASLPKIGEEFGGRDHSTVIHAYEKVKSEADQDARLAHTLRELSEKLKNG